MTPESSQRPDFQPPRSPTAQLADQAAARVAALVEFRRMMIWIAVIAVVMTLASLWGLSLAMPLTTPMVLAVVGGVFFSVLLGSGLFAAAFFSNKSGYDQRVSGVTRLRSSGDPSEPRD